VDYYKYKASHAQVKQSKQAKFFSADPQPALGQGGRNPLKNNSSPAPSPSSVRRNFEREGLERKAGLDNQYGSLGREPPAAEGQVSGSRAPSFRRLWGPGGKAPSRWRKFAILRSKYSRFCVFLDRFLTTIFHKRSFCWTKWYKRATTLCWIRMCSLNKYSALNDYILTLL